MMAFRVLQYVSRVWARWRRENPQAKRLPEIVPIVLYIGQRPWTAANAFEDLVDGGDSPSTRMRFVLDDLSRISEAELAGRALEAFGEVWREEGRQEGRQEGRHQARAQTILRQLQLKFGPLNEETVARVESGSETEFERWTERVLVADKLSQIFGG